MGSTNSHRRHKLLWLACVALISALTACGKHTPSISETLESRAAPLCKATFEGQGPAAEPLDSTKGQAIQYVATEGENTWTPKAAPDGLEAKTEDSVHTIICEYDTKYPERHYEHGVVGYTQERKFKLLTWPDGVMHATYSFRGESPPEGHVTVSKGQTAVTGSAPSEESIEKWLREHILS
jgi:hypothetical protein